MRWQGAATCRSPDGAQQCRRKLGTRPALLCGLLLALASAQLTFASDGDVGAVGGAAAEQSQDGLIWPCEPAGPLKAGSVHVVVSTLTPDPEQLLPWLWQLGLSGAGAA
jgi:hypothetical protein